MYLALSIYVLFISHMQSVNGAQFFKYYFFIIIIFGFSAGGGIGAIVIVTLTSIYTSL